MNYRFNFSQFLLMLGLSSLLLTSCQKVANERSANSAKGNIDRAIEIVKAPINPFGNMYMELQARIRLMWLDEELEYEYNEAHEGDWLRLLNDDGASIYARICAASFLLGHHEDAKNSSLPKRTRKI